MSELCHELHEIFNARPRFRFPFDDALIPANGIYVLFESNELAHGCDRIVRVGTHTGQNQLPSRLKQHFVLENKDRSIFRKNIGRAVLVKASDPFAPEWETDLTTRAARSSTGQTIDNERLREIEQDVSRHIQDHFSFAVFEVDDKDKRLLLESRLISTISRCETCEPSLTWLGRESPKAKIRESGLWLVNELYKDEFSEQEAELLRRVLTNGGQSPSHNQLATPASS